jgi:hypothetical protein
MAKLKFNNKLKPSRPLNLDEANIRFNSDPKNWFDFDNPKSAGKRLISYIDENGNILEEYTGTGAFVDEDYEIIEDPNDEQFEMGFGNQRFAPSAFMGNKLEGKLVKTKPKK